MQVNAGGRHVHHHSLLAGVSAGTAGVLCIFGLLLLAWRTIGHAVGVAGTVIVWAVTALVLAAVAYGVGLLGLRLRHHVTHPETLTRQAVRAEGVPAAVPALPAAAQAALPAPERAALPPGVRLLPRDPEEAIAMIREWSGRSER